MKSCLEKEMELKNDPIIEVAVNTRLAEGGINRRRKGQSLSLY